MADQNSKSENQQRRLDPELLKKGLRCDLDQYDMLNRCSDKKDITEWNEWREKNPTDDVFLEGANLDNCYLRGAFLNTGKFKDDRGRKFDFTGKVYLDSANLNRAKLESAWLQRSYIRGAILRAYLRGAKLWHAHLEGTDLWRAHIENADFYGAYLQGAHFSVAQVDGQTLIAECKVDKHTDFAGVALSNACVEPGLQQLLEYNVRRLGWKKWYHNLPRLDWRRNEPPCKDYDLPTEDKLPIWQHILKRGLVWPVWLFWSISDYGRSTGRIVASSCGVAAIFAVVYWLWPGCIVVGGQIGNVHGFMHALYLSVMVMIGTGDISASPDRVLGQVLLVLQVILGYVLLAALVTRFAILFTAGGPAGKFADERSIYDRLSQLWARMKGKDAKQP
jgi:uncharacterized protein YjbI with pentapeptide repeats